MWGRRGRVVVPRGGGWRSGLAALFFGYVIAGIFSKIYLDIITSTITIEEHYTIERMFSLGLWVRHALAGFDRYIVIVNTQQQ